MHIRRSPLLLLLLLALAACGPAADESAAPAGPGAGDDGPAAVLERAVRALGGPDAVRAATTTLVVRMERSAPLPEEGREAPVVEYVLAPPDRLARRTERDGLVRRSALDGERMWLRAGAAVRDLGGEAVADETARRDDLLCLLVEPLRSGRFELQPESRADGAPAVRVRRPGGATRVLVLDRSTGLPARVERLGPDGSIVVAWGYSAFEPVAGPGSLLFPRRIDDVRGEAASSWRVTDVVAADGVDEAAWFDRPHDAGPGEHGEITRRTVAAVNAVVVEHTGPLTDLARVDRLIAHALSISHARSLGPTVRVFDALPAGEGGATVTTYVPVRLSRDPEAGNLPRGVGVRAVAATDVLAARYRGPYPRSRSVYAPLEARARELGLVAAGAPRHVVLSDPDEGEPCDLQQELLLPVKPAE